MIHLLVLSIVFMCLTLLCRPAHWCQLQPRQCWRLGEKVEDRLMGKHWDIWNYYDTHCIRLYIPKSASIHLIALIVKLVPELSG